MLRWTIALAFGIALALYAYQRIADPRPRQQRMQEEAVVLEAREILRSYLPYSGDVEIVDPLNKNRVAGKVYVYPIDEGWQVSGHYRPAGDVFWQPWLMTLDQDAALLSLRVRDVRLAERAANDPRLVFMPPE